MPEAYCVKCGKMVRVKEPAIITIKGRKALYGQHGACGTEVFKFLPRTKSKAVERSRRRKPRGLVSELVK